MLKSTELFQQKFLQILFEDFSNGKIAIEDMENLSNIQGENILHDFFIEILNDKDAVKTIDNSIDENSLELTQKFINGEIPELELIKDNFHSTLDEQKPVIKNAIGDIYKTIDKAILVSCYCSSMDNALMWAHYANKHKGFCVEYNFSKSTNFELLLNLNPVIYSDNRAMLPQNMFYIDEDDQIKVATTNQSTAELICALLTKSNVWEYEKEWRLILPSKNTTNRLYKMDCITKVILGCNIESQYENQIRDICIKKGY